VEFISFVDVLEFCMYNILCANKTSFNLCILICMPLKLSYSCPVTLLVSLI
jgi:hypothetical protein